MSSSIWTRCGASSNLRPLMLKAWRAVEAQLVVATRKIVDSLEEQRILEQLIAESERPGSRSVDGVELHDLLAAPFRDPPLRHGSRFGRPSERGLWYGSETERTAFAEVSYYRLVFLAGTAADLSPLMVELATYRTAVHTERGVDLTIPPFERWQGVLASKTDYAPTQALGVAMRRDGVEAFRYISARDVEGGVNVALFSPRAFAARRPRTLHAWICVATHAGVELFGKDPLGRRSFYFPRLDFEVDGALPAPAL